MMSPKVKSYIDQYLESLHKFFLDRGEYMAQITIFATSKDGQLIIMPMILPPQVMQDDQAKDRFIQHELPKIARATVKHLKVEAVLFGTEAWIREAANEEVEKIGRENYRQLPITGEVVIIYVQHEEDEKCHVYDIHRVGKKVNEDGDLFDEVTLTVNDKLTGNMQGGRFAGLYKIFNDASLNHS